MRRRVLMCLVAVTLSAVGWAAGGRPGSAATSQACTYNEVWTFTPSLTKALVTGGQAVLNGTYSCVIIESSGAVGTTQGAAGPGTFTYNGSCLAASLSGPFNQTGEIVGGSAIVLHAFGGTSGDSSVTALAGVPDALCNKGSEVLVTGTGKV